MRFLLKCSLYLITLIVPSMLLASTSQESIQHGLASNPAQLKTSSAISLLLLGNEVQAENNLFSQPQDNGDSTCGVRQTLISQKVLTKADNFHADILATWKLIHAQTLTNYPVGVPKETPIPTLTEMFEKALPSVYTEAAVKAADGGPFTPPSSILSVLKDNDYKLVQYYVDEGVLIQLFGNDFITDEFKIFDETFPESQRVDIDASTSPEILRTTFNNVESYYIIVVNNGDHWIGVTSTTIYDSLAMAQVDDTITFGKLNGNPDATSYNSFTGLVMEIQKNR